MRLPRPASAAVRPLATLAFVGLLVTTGTAGQQAPDRSRPPAVGPMRALTLPPVIRKTLSNGLPVWIVEMHDVPLVEVGLVVAGGAAADPAGAFGAASVTANLLDEGAGERTSLQIADAIDYLGASLVTGSSYDASFVRLGVPVARLGAALPILADVVERPTFPEQELARFRQERLTAMLQARDNPAALAAESFPRLLFGAERRYGVPELGTPASLAALTVADLKAFYQSHYRPDQSTILVVGDVQSAAVLPLLESAFGTWAAAGPAAPASAAAPAPVATPQPTGRRIVIVDKPGAAQSQIRIGWVGVPRSTPEYFPLVVLNTVLGGSFTSRLNQNLREQHGYAYGAGSAFSMRRAAGPFAAAAGVQTDKTAESLTEFFKELDAIRAPIPEVEVDRARSYVAAALPPDFETIEDVAGRLQDLVVYGLPPDYYDQYVAHVRAVTAADLSRVAATWIHPARSLVVVVGDAQVIAPKIRALNLGAVTVSSVDQVLGPPPEIAAHGQ